MCDRFSDPSDLRQRIGETAMRFENRGIDRECAAKGGNRLIVAFLLDLHAAEIGVGFGVVIG